MKKIKSAIIIMASLVVAAVVIFLIANNINNNNIKDKEAEENKLEMFSFNNDDITKVEIQNESGTYTAEFEAGSGWKLTNTDEFELNASAVAAISSNMANLKATKILNDTDLSKYGLDNPVKITASDGDNSYVIYVGNATPTYENYYAMKENDDNIYLISYKSGAVLKVSKDLLKRTYLFSYLSYDIDHYALWKGKQTDDNILFSMNKTDDNDWVMERPYKDNPVNYTQVDTFLTNASKDQINTFVQENCQKKDYSKYGFDDPQYVFEISAGDQHKTIIFGDSLDNGIEMYGLFEESGQVVTFISDEISLLNYTTTDMMITSVFTADINKVAEVNVKMPDSEATLELAAGKNGYTFNGKNVEEKGEDAMDAFTTFFNAFNNAYFDSIENSATPSGEAELSFKYTLTSNVVTTIEYIPVPDSDMYWAIRDGEYTGFTVEKIIISNMISTYEKLNEQMAD